jgi:hypothetical protein
MKIEQLIDSLDEARRNNYGREISNVQGQALGKQLATNAPGAQQALAQAQSTTQPAPQGDTLGQTTPAQRLAAKKANSAPVNLPGKQTAAPVAPTTPVVPPPAETPATTPAADTTTPAPTTTTPATTNPADTTTTAPAGKKPGIDWKKGIQGFGDVASQVTGAIGQTVGAVGGGLGRGYHTARQGKKFGGLDALTANNYAGDPYQQGGGGGAGGGAAGDAEVAQLKADIANITGRLNKAGIAEKKQR